MIKNKRKIVCISDTHTHTSDFSLPPGDILIHAGDFSKTGLPEEVATFNDFLSKQPFAYKIVIAGNHDLTFDNANYPEVLKQNIRKNNPFQITSRPFMFGNKETINRSNLFRR